MMFEVGNLEIKGKVLSIEEHYNRVVFVTDESRLVWL